MYGQGAKPIEYDFVIRDFMEKATTRTTLASSESASASR
jgi:hypothetical protein